MAERRPLTNAQLKARLELCRDFGVAAYEESADGVKFTLAPRSGEREGQTVSPEELAARKAAEFRRVATLHSSGGRGR